MRLPQSLRNTRAAAARLCSSRFQQGTYWLWEYRDRSGAFTCAERYEVCDVLGPSTIMLEMASKLEEGEEFNSHHRMIVDLAKPLAAAGLDGWQTSTAWNLELFAFKDEEGEWQRAMHRWNTQAFEEKFDLHSMLPTQPSPIRVVSFQQRQVPALSRHATLIRSRRLQHTKAWYVREPREHSGLAAFKAFGSAEYPMSYTFELVDFGDDIRATKATGERPARPAATSAPADMRVASRLRLLSAQPSRSRRALVRAACVAATCAPLWSARPALAWCGGYFPGKLSNEWDELLVEYENAAQGYKTDIFVRIVDPPRRRVYGGANIKEYRELPRLPPVLVVGCPGVNYEYLENLEGVVVSGRRVILLNTCEAPVDRDARAWMPPAESSPGPAAMRRPLEAAKQILAVCDALSYKGPRIESVHVFAHGLGGAAALHMVELLKERSMQRDAEAKAAETTATEVVVSDVTATMAKPVLRIASLSLASPYGAIEDLNIETRRRIEYNAEVTPLEFDGSDGGQPVEGQQCVVEATLLTGLPWREALLRPSKAESQAERLGGSSLANRLPSPGSVPTQVIIGGPSDSVDPSWDLRSRPDVAQVSYPTCGHLPFLDRRLEFLSNLLDFYDQVDGVNTSRSGLSDGRST